ncbi:MAG: hypothetical protein KDA41_20855 [Planctomycetales bacterium]|nr:hypothetical protein [Planctomycetales bacterium]
MNSIDSAISSVIAAKESAIQTQVQFALAAKSLSAQKQQGEAMVQLVEAVAQMGKSLGRGLLFDAAG